MQRAGLVQEEKGIISQRQDRRNVGFQAARIVSRQGDFGDRVPEWCVDAEQ